MCFLYPDCERIFKFLFSSEAVWLRHASLPFGISLICILRKHEGEFSRKTSQWIAAALLAVMAILMLVAARNDSATVDETTFLSTGYTYLTGHRYHFSPEHPPVSQMLPAIPLLFMDVNYSDNARRCWKAGPATLGRVRGSVRSERGRSTSQWA